MKKIISIMLCLCLLLSLAACGGESVSSVPTVEPTVEPTPRSYSGTHSRASGG